MSRHSCSYSRDSQYIAAWVGAADSSCNPLIGSGCLIALPNRPGLAKAVKPSLRRLAGLAHELATAALVGNIDRSEILIRRLALETSPEHAMALGSGAR